MALIDENSKPVVRLSLANVYWEAERNFLVVAKICLSRASAEQVMLLHAVMAILWSVDNFLWKVSVHRMEMNGSFYIAKIC